MANEKWRDIPEFEGLYKLSNYGRVKSLPRETMMNSPNGGSYMSKEKIRKAKVDVKFNKTTQQNIYSLGMTLYRDAIAYHYSLPRLTYYVFKEKFNLENSSELISFKDHDGRNTHISNLVRTTIGQIKLASYREKRAISHLSVLSKPVTQFDGQGKVIAHFPSMYEAGRLTGFNSRNIAEVVSGQGHMFKGYFWKAGIHRRNLSLTKIRRNTERDEINTTLTKRLKIRFKDKSSIPAIVNLSLASMPGEKWKAAPGYQGLYLVSNYGRVKALGKITQGLQQKWMPEQIQKIMVDFRKDRKGKWVAGSTFACMAVEGRKKQVSIPRLVYFLFVKRYDIADTNVRVYYKDGNSLNVKYSNLCLYGGVRSFVKQK
ncbi:NUMOD4 domain-containing protein [Chryseolinea lacunae]|uniref:NUMOD4 domain-containing protein n=1 Tax=Chryseolinea lacunae TaxID=2801331 RepID=A0ABS1L5X1_9BACT|nr:NUMOD4 domain-containing protein [Chryseolinea lacunae]MBL0745926.1 hypothetical protein [Chryseolinea lacunae]